MVRTVYRVVVYLRARICSPRIRCVRGMHVRTYGPAVYAHVRATVSRERVSRILDARYNALSRCGIRAASEGFRVHAAENVRSQRNASVGASYALLSRLHIPWYDQTIFRKVTRMFCARASKSLCGFRLLWILIRIKSRSRLASVLI